MDPRARSLEMNHHTMASDMSVDALQQRIQQARRDAEALKDRIKRKKDELADTTCKR